MSLNLNVVKYISCLYDKELYFECNPPGYKKIARIIKIKEGESGKIRDSLEIAGIITTFKHTETKYATRLNYSIQDTFKILCNSEPTTNVYEIMKRFIEDNKENLIGGSAL